ncbi:hypothetical protein [Wolbachia endosymbiont (group B) of Erebia ligea]|uniref:hypothetical protein n=1 Tax=Wolbachia endosymbiont (group B) of Erebia ligea TaxID=2954010 RepID=UPI0021F91E0E|nr:hypothetical protein [Wolbachia endosymbiont (group B) of Erebia ligea]
MPGNEQNVTLLSHTAVNENGAATSPIPTPRTSTPKQNGKNTLPPEKVEKIISNIPASNSALLIFDFNQTIVESPICNQFASKNYSDYGSGKENAVTDEKIKEFLQNSGIKNKEKLKSVLQSALSSGVEVAVVSTIYPKAVEYVVKNHLGLAEDQAQSIKIFEGVTKRQTSRIADPAKTTEPQDPQIGKHLCVLYLLKAYKKDKGMLPQKAMLVDGNMWNTNPVDDFCRNIKELLEKDMNSLLENIDQEIAEVDISEAELENITFKGINVSGEQTTDKAADGDYLDEVGVWMTDDSTDVIMSTTPSLERSSSSGSADSKPEKPAYAVIDKSKKTPDNQTDSQHPTLSRSVSQETEFNEPCNRNESEKKPFENLSQHSDTPSTSPPSYTSRSSSQESLPTDREFKLQKNRFWPKAQYAMEQKGVVIFGAATIVLGTSTALAYLQDKAKFITFFTNSPLYTVVPIIAVASLLAISPMLLGIKQFVNTKEYQTQVKNADEVLDNVLMNQPEGKVIKSVRLEYSNGTHSNFVLNAWESKKGFVNIDEKVISKTNKIESVINNRPLFTALLTGVVAANIALPLLLYMEGGVNNIQKFYQNPLTNHIKLLPLTGLGIVALLAVYLGVHYYRKTNCTNLVYSEETIDPKNVNGKFIEEIKRERTNVLGENHSKDAKRSSLTLEQVVVQSHNYKDAIYSIGG